MSAAYRTGIAPSRMVRFTLFITPYPVTRKVLMSVANRTAIATGRAVRFTLFITRPGGA